jgi:hypothetical protein
VKLRSGDLLFFLHIPKTAGTSFSTILASQFAPQEICPFPYDGFESQLRLTPHESLLPYRLMHAHCDYTIYRLLPRIPVFITMLREPTSRFISTYHHIRRDPTHRLHRIVTAEDLSLLEFVRHTAAQKLHNQMLARLAGGAAHLDDQTRLDIAQARLFAMPFAGLTEHFAESIHLLAYTFEWQITSAAMHLNAAPHQQTQSEPDDQVIEAIQTANSLDVRLYQFAVSLFKTRLAEAEMRPCD